MDYLNSTYGLVTDSDPTTENGQLFLTELILLKQLNGSDFSNERSVYVEQLFYSYVEKGLYNRNPELTTRTTSHDNLSAIFAFSYLTKGQHRFWIWNYLLKHLGTYDNTKNKSSQFSRFLPFNPANFFVWGKMAESKIFWLFYPFYLINLIISCSKPAENTSGKLLTFVELTPLKNEFMFKHLYNYYESKMKKQYGEQWIKTLFKTYFPNEGQDFPIYKELDKLK